jgi:hypothetical protein
MTHDELFQALLAVDLALETCPGWLEIKEIASAYPIALDEALLTPGQQAVMILWRIFSVDSEGQANAPHFEEASAEVIGASLEQFRASFAEEVLVGGELDRDSIRSLFQMAQASGED